MITTELETVWITSDGKKFLSEKEAKGHEQINNKEKLTWLAKLQQNLT
jgi:hypothetical protein